MQLVESRDATKRRRLGLKLTRSQIAAYLDRIDYRGPTEKTAATLRELHLAHMFAVPFENLDISAGHYINLDLESLFHKIVTQRRGGFCYELNGLFAMLLRGLGYRVDHLSAGVAQAGGGFSPDFDHMTLLVGTGDVWLADVGFGDSFLAPVHFAIGGEGTSDPAGWFNLRLDGNYHILERRSDTGDWLPMYRFTLATYALKSFAPRCHYQQTSPESHFTKKRVCSLARPNGRITLSDLRLITTNGSDRTERELRDDEEFDSVLQDEFGIVLLPGRNIVH
jgi:N-hydroxyarylamine O-acetyltransferase